MHKIFALLLTASVCLGGCLGDDSMSSNNEPDDDKPAPASPTASGPNDGLWNTPAAAGSASFAVAAALAQCRSAWQADAHPAFIQSPTRNTPWYVVSYSVADPDHVCEWNGLNGGNANITPKGQYAPGWTYQAADHVGGWAVEFADIRAKTGFGEIFTFMVSPAQHRRQTGWTLAGVADNTPVILAFESATRGPLFLFDGRTGAQIDRKL